MKSFSSKKCFVQNRDVNQFIQHYFPTRDSVLFISTLGVYPDSLFFPGTQLNQLSNVDFKIIIEKRRHISSTIATVGAMHQEYMKQVCTQGNIEFVEIEIVADDGATIGGRNAVGKAIQWYQKRYSDIVIDATGMSRGICFPLIQQAVAIGVRDNVNVHLLIASSENRSLTLTSESNDSAEWMHGFQGNMGLDKTADALRLWVPQLSEDASNQMEIMYRALSSTGTIAEVCPIVPFPSLKVRRSDELLFTFESSFYNEWECNHLNVIYAHESNPLDVLNSIKQLTELRKEFFQACNHEQVTILSPSGWRIGSLGMLLAAIDLDLPILYVETIGYNTTSPIPPNVVITQPDHMWHILLTGAPYGNSQL